MSRPPWRVALAIALAFAIWAVVDAPDHRPGPDRPEPYCDGTTRVWVAERDLELQAWAPECLPSTSTAPR